MVANYNVQELTDVFKGSLDKAHKGLVADRPVSQQVVFINDGLEVIS